MNKIYFGRQVVIKFEDIHAVDFKQSGMKDSYSAKIITKLGHTVEIYREEETNEFREQYKKYLKGD